MHRSLLQNILQQIASTGWALRLAAVATLPDMMSEKDDDPDNIQHQGRQTDVLRPLAKQRRRQQPDHGCAGQQTRCLHFGAADRVEDHQVASIA
jgi:hypothetical protein